VNQQDRRLRDGPGHFRGQGAAAIFGNDAHSVFRPVVPLGLNDQAAFVLGRSPFVP
jgi:D-aminopeptidase